MRRRPERTASRTLDTRPSISLRLTRSCGRIPRRGKRVYTSMWRMPRALRLGLKKRASRRWNICFSTGAAGVDVQVCVGARQYCILG
ncbi:hypothetical protein EJ03DRAFT_358996 [Teratosphaeria nubilosa]|uniref:Uncharacterized protein n=1 Tax=Teratosphaeria nubilosa TaxID=161662 RepID=A0A6G1LEL2_9PEZI|nr:hypothetical protein EJ03DRAFT_358996 [Teratosphaeria nubilosa]